MWNRPLLSARIPVFLMFAGGLLYTSAYAEPDPVELEPIVVTATRLDKDVYETPYTGYSIPSETLLNETMSRTIPDALREVPGVMVQKTSYGQGSPYMRGFTGFRTLFLIDGIRLNNSVFREGPNQYWNTVDPYSLEGLEIIMGPASVLYGSDAIGGLVNAKTLRPSYRDGSGYHFSGRGLYRWSEAENSHTARAQLSATYEKGWGIVSGFTLKDFGDLEGGEEVGLQRKTGYEEWDGDIKLEHFFSPDSRITLAYQTVDQDDVWRTHTTEYGISWEGTQIGADHARILDQGRDLIYLQYGKRDRGSIVNELKLSLSYHSQDEEQYRLRTTGGNLRSEIQGLDVNTLGISTQMASRSRFGNWTYGMEYYRDKVRSHRKDYNGDVRQGGTLRSVSIQGPVADDATYDMLGVYIQDDIPATQALDLVLGARYNYMEADADKVQDPVTGDQISVHDHWNAVAGSMRALYRLDTENHYHLFGGISQGFRAPNLSDLTRLDTARSNEIETPSPDLEPEKYITYEIGLKTRHQTLSSQLVYFYTDIQDMIVRAPTGRIIGGNYEVTKKNAGDGYLQGVELSFTWSFTRQIGAFGSFSWQDGEVEGYPTSSPNQEKEPISRLMPATVQTGIRWKPTAASWLEGLLVIADEQHNLSASDRADMQRIPPGGMPGYEIITFRGGWEINPYITLSAALENLTDEDYRIHGSGLNEAGRNLILTLDCRF